MKKLWDWVKNVFSRIGDLIIKLISVKVTGAVITTLVFLRIESPRTTDFLIVAVVWLGVAGVRYMEKVAGVLRKPPKE